MIALIVTEGPARGRRALQRLAAAADLVVAANGGARRARAAGLAPHLLVGDQDSLGAETREWAAARGATALTYPREKDATDAELALRVAAGRGADDVWIFNAPGGRTDQWLANVLLLFEARRLGVRARVLDGRAAASLVEGEAEVRGRRGDLVSLLPLSPTVDGVVTQGLRYPLQGETLHRGSTRGVSNEITQSPATIRIAAGDLLLIHGRS